MSQQINLFNPLFVKQKQVFTAVAMGGALAVLVAGSLALALYGQSQVAALERDSAALGRHLVQQQARLERVNVEFAPRQKDARIEGEVAQAQAGLKAMQEAAAVLERGEFGHVTGYAEYFRAFARQSVDGLWLTGVAIQGAGNDIDVRGRALEARTVPAYMGRLANEPVLRGKAFSSLLIAQAAPAEGPVAVRVGAPYVDFKLQSKAPGAAEPIPVERQ